jgi:phospholipid/cholesterol/gamma-HCH transport system substrate-binding protein
MSKEIKVALLAIFTLLVAYWGFRFIQGKNILTRSNLYYVEYEDVTGLKSSSSVTISGVEKGTVASIQNTPDDPMKVLVTLDMDRGTRIPQDAVARIMSDGLMGGKYITLVFDAPCSGTDCAEPGDFLQGENLGLLASTLDPDELKTTLDEVTTELRSFVNVLRKDILEDRDSSTLARTLANLESTTANFDRISYRFDRVLRRQESNIDSTLEGLATLGQTLKSNAGNIDTIFRNLTALSEQLGDHNLSGTLDSVDIAVASLNRTLRGADSSVANLKVILEGLREGEGTLGKLLSDDELYFQLSDLGIQIDSFLNDVSEKPYRYIPFKSRRKVKKYDRKDEKQEEIEE